LLFLKEVVKWQYLKTTLAAILEYFKSAPITKFGNLLEHNLFRVQQGMGKKYSHV